MFSINRGQTYQSSYSASLLNAFFKTFIIQLICFLLFLLLIIISLQRLLQLGSDLLEEADLLTEVVLHLRSEVPYTCTVKVLDLSQCGTGNNVAAIMELSFLLWTIFHLSQCTWKKIQQRKEGKGLESEANIQSIELHYNKNLLDQPQQGNHRENTQKCSPES